MAPVGCWLGRKVGCRDGGVVRGSEGKAFGLKLECGTVTQVLV
jgi:hypothetical protein